VGRVHFPAVCVVSHSAVRVIWRDTNLMYMVGSTLNAVMCVCVCVHACVCVFIAGLLLQSIQFQVQVMLVSLRWSYKSGECTKSCAHISVLLQLPRLAVLSFYIYIISGTLIIVFGVPEYISKSVYTYLFTKHSCKENVSPLLTVNTRNLK
jgi:hypothetical protein